MTAAIQVKNVSKRYRLGHGLPGLWSMLGKQKNVRQDEYHWAVKDVSFELQPGEALGIIGPNGAGKTTILKLLSHVTYPTSGKIKVNGRFSSLIELGAGFHPDLTGRENIYLNGTILGMRKAEIKDRFDQIIEFAGIGQYLDTPVKRYSSGMNARLGFAVAAHVNPEVLLVDEVLAVGDFSFQQKCHARMDELRANGTSLIFVAHNMDAVRRVCDRGMVMYQGRNIFQGTAAEAIVAYSDAVRQAARETDVQVPVEGGLAQRVMTFDAEIERVNLLDEAGQPVNVVQSGTTTTLVVDVNFHKTVHRPVFGFVVRTPRGQRVYATTTRWLNIETPTFRAGERHRIEYTLNLSLLEGSYEIGVDAAVADLSHYYDRLERALDFQVIDSNSAKGLVDLDAKVTFKKLTSIETVPDFNGSNVVATLDNSR